MYKKLISSILVVTLLGQVGCYTATEVTVDYIIEDEERDHIYLTTTDSLRYKFDEPNYKIVDDTLHGEGVMLTIEDDEISFLGSIPIKDIQTIVIDKFNWINTIGLYLVLLGTFWALDNWANPDKDNN